MHLSTHIFVPPPKTNLCALLVVRLQPDQHCHVEMQRDTVSTTFSLLTSMEIELLQKFVLVLCH